MKYYKYTYPNGDTEFYSVADNEQKLQIRVGKIEAVGISNAGPPIVWLELKAEETTEAIFWNEYYRVMGLVQLQMSHITGNVIA